MKKKNIVGIRIISLLDFSIGVFLIGAFLAARPWSIVSYVHNPLFRRILTGYISAFFVFLVPGAFLIWLGIKTLQLRRSSRIINLIFAFVSFVIALVSVQAAAKAADPYTVSLLSGVLAVLVIAYLASPDTKKQFR